MKRIVKLTALALALLALLSLAGCGSELRGKWRSTSEKRTQLTLSAAGRAEMSADGITLTGTYDAEDGRLIMTLLAPNEEVYVIEATYELHDDYLYLENSKGQVEVFQK